MIIPGKCEVAINESWQNKHMPVTHYINRLIERDYKTQSEWFHAPLWEQDAIWDYTRKLANRWCRIYDCRCWKD